MSATKQFGNVGTKREEEWRRFYAPTSLPFPIKEAAAGPQQKIPIVSVRLQAVNRGSL